VKREWERSAGFIPQSGQGDVRLEFSSSPLEGVEVLPHECGAPEMSVTFYILRFRQYLFTLLTL